MCANSSTARLLQHKNNIPALFTELKSRLISLTAKSTWNGAICQPKLTFINQERDGEPLFPLFLIPAHEELVGV